MAGVLMVKHKVPMTGKTGMEGPPSNLSWPESIAGLVPIPVCAVHLDLAPLQSPRIRPPTDPVAVRIQQRKLLELGHALHRQQCGWSPAVQSSSIPASRSSWVWGFAECPTPA